MIKPIVEKEDLQPNNISREDWTFIIPAAGHGTRLGYDLPKILYPLLKKTLLFWLLEVMQPVTSSFVFVLSPSGRAVIEAKLEHYLEKENFSIVEQEHPTGMADAILLCQHSVKSKNVAVVWGDQVLLKKDTVYTCAWLHEQRTNAVLTFPTIIKKNPYIHFERYADQSLKAVLQYREGEIKTEYGENDCGLFMFNTKALFKALNEAKTKGASIGSGTREFNLLPVLPMLEQGTDDGAVVTLRINDDDETVGLNNKEEAQFAEKILSARMSQK